MFFSVFRRLAGGRGWAASRTAGLEECLSRQLEAVTKGRVDHHVANVRDKTAKKLRARLTVALTNFTGYPVDVRATTDPQLLGGFVANIGDVVIDASLRHRLELAREALLEPGRVTGATGAAGGPTSTTGKPGQH